MTYQHNWIKLDSNEIETYTEYCIGLRIAVI